MNFKYLAVQNDAVLSLIKSTADSTNVFVTEELWRKISLTLKIDRITFEDSLMVLISDDLIENVNEDCYRLTATGLKFAGYVKQRLSRYRPFYITLYIIIFIFALIAVAVSIYVNKHFKVSLTKIGLVLNTIGAITFTITTNSENFYVRLLLMRMNNRSPVYSPKREKQALADWAHLFSKRSTYNEAINMAGWVVFILGFVLQILDKSA